MKPLLGKTAVITGGARGLGRVYALRLAELGANIGVIDIDLFSYKKYKAEAKSISEATVVEEIQKSGGNPIGIEADVGVYEEIKSAINKIAETFGNIDILIANAGGGAGKMDENNASCLDLDQYKEVMDRNITGTVHTVKAVAPLMKAQNYGKIITVSSIAASYPFPNGTYAHYGTAKTAIIGYTRYLAQDLGPYNINVNCMLLGRIATGRSLSILNERVDTDFTSPIALKRLGNPEECANVVEFLSTPQSSYITGAVIEVTGGYLGFS
ncbi:3-oxoacyl-[acyl-carrier-protein] reductase OS=Ureibacillus acetophenoni OX=614649 GN=SAMN05877842_101438 PE=3 SV=1 [Ureibacillus acetophenoni]